MTVMYVREQGAVVRRASEQVKVTQAAKGDGQLQVLQALPVRDLEQVVLYGNVQVTTPAVALLLEHEVDVIFLSRYGTFRGRLGKTGSKFARLRHAQLRLAGDEGKSLALALAIVQAKLANQRNLLLQWREQTQGAQAAMLQQAANGVAQMRRACGQATTTEVLRGFEGKAGAYYFGGVKALLGTEWGFVGRAYYPAPDAFNALLSFGYTLLLKDVTTTIELVGLDPYLGCFHVLEYNRPSLTLDLMEEFRPLAVDQTVMALALQGAIKPGDFTYTGKMERPVVLGEALLPILIEAYAARMNTVLRHSPTGTQQRLQHCLELQARSFERVVLGLQAAYSGMEG